MPMAELMTEGSWNPILDPNLIEWRNKLQLASKPSGQKPPQPKSGSRFASDSSMGRSMMDPNQIKLTKLCLNPPTAHQKVEKPIIEVLNKETNQFEACEYEIKEEDLQTLDPVQSNLKNSQSYHELKIMLLHAGDLIRTKSNWGTKSKDNVIDLTITILNLQDTVTPLYKHRDGGPKSYAYKESKLLTQQNQTSTQDYTGVSISASLSPKSEVYTHFLQLIVTRLTWSLNQYLHRSTTKDQAGVMSGSGWMVLFKPILVLKIIDFIKLLSFINLSSGSHSLTVNMVLVKEVVPILIKI
ncbi:hypothetical protein PSTG_05243 [Puccinia striiformis f. sp. tritici PST-78]|uniref:Telomere length regulation protein conserved domain-containing protein n=1 Tax=Puccinia striiformis f. sp. tritici PST-78 TaxID=1165861 RepID=A0A0L0VR56_9BASI|nr:hypothetical protein PSTG_05243 [Puccinia striiformis f. sp. tritici PST-78]